MTDDKLGELVCFVRRAAEGENDGISTAAPLREARILPGSSGADGAPQAWIEDHCSSRRLQRRPQEQRWQLLRPSVLAQPQLNCFCPACCPREFQRHSRVAP